MSVDLGQILTENMEIKILVDATAETVRIETMTPCTVAQLLVALLAAYNSALIEAEARLDNIPPAVVH